MAFINNMSYNINNFNDATKSTNTKNTNNLSNINNNTNNFNLNTSNTSNASNTCNTSFKQILEQNNNTTNFESDKALIFSKHATLRLNDRNISLSNSQLERVESGIQTAQKKCIKDSLVLVDNVALVVNIKNKTVVTAMDNNNNNNNNNKEQVYTNIDGAIIV